MTLGSGLEDVPARQIILINIFYTCICTAYRVSFFGDYVTNLIVKNFPLEKLKLSSILFLVLSSLMNFKTLVGY